MKNNIELNLNITMSKVAAIIMIVGAFFFGVEVIVIAWPLAAALLGFKQGMNTIKEVRNVKQNTDSTISN